MMAVTLFLATQAALSSNDYGRLCDTWWTACLTFRDHYVLYIISATTSYESLRHFC